MKTILTIFLGILVLSSGTVTAQKEILDSQHNSGINTESPNKCSKFKGYLPANLDDFKGFGSPKVCAYLIWWQASVVDLENG